MSMPHPFHTYSRAPAYLIRHTQGFRIAALRAIESVSRFPRAMRAAAAADAADAVPASDESKRAAYAAVTADLAAFFESEASAEAKRGGGSGGAPWAGIDTVGRMSLLCAFLARAFPSWHFVGFYVVAKKAVAAAAAAAGAGSDSDGLELQIGPYQGDVLATARIEFGRGQCGACAAARATQIAADVSVCANYIPCDDVTRSEIVVPVFGRNAHNEPEDAAAARRMIAVFDVDSPVLGNFNETDKAGLEALLAAYF
jgi:L-methionine (R)-S-oxide reductase